MNKGKYHVMLEKAAFNIVKDVSRKDSQLTQRLCAHMSWHELEIVPALDITCVGCTDTHIWFFWNCEGKFWCSSQHGGLTSLLHCSCVCNLCSSSRYSENRKAGKMQGDKANMQLWSRVPNGAEWQGQHRAELPREAWWYQGFSGTVFI